MTIDTARCECATCTTNPDPRRFYMRLTAGVKHVSDANAPNVSVPFCFAHERWPCIDCGTKHGDDCECPYCTEPAPSHVQSMVLRSMADSHSNDEVRSMARELLSARSRIAELEAGVRKWASECGECDGKGFIRAVVTIHRDGHVDRPCEACADIRALLPKESDAQGKRDE